MVLRECLLTCSVSLTHSFSAAVAFRVLSVFEFVRIGVRSATLGLAEVRVDPPAYNNNNVTAVT